MALVTFSILAPSGDEITLATSADEGGSYGLLVGTAGLGLASRDVKLTTASGDGGRLRSVRVAPRDATLRVLVHGRDELTRTVNLRRLAAAVRAAEDLPAPKLVATYATGEVYELPFVFEGGAEDLARQWGNASVEVPLNVIFPDPFWTARDALSFQLTGSQAVIGLLPDLAALKIAPSWASGTATVDNPGEVRSFPVWRIVGPATSVTASARGKSWQIGPVAAGEIVTIDSRTNAVTLANGTNVYTRLGTAPKFFPLPAGRTEVAVTMTGTDANSVVSCFYRPRMEVVI